MKHTTGAKLSARAERFVAEYLVDLNATQAAIRAGYSPRGADVTGARLLGDARVAEAIRTAVRPKLERLELSADRVLQELGKIAFCDIRRLFKADGAVVPLSELDAATAGAIASFEVQTRPRDGRAPVVTVARVRLADRLRGLELLAKYFGLLRDRVELDIDVSKLEALSPERLEEVGELALAARRTLEALRRA